MNTSVPANPDALLRAPPTGILFDMGDTLLHEISFDPRKGSKRLFDLAHNTEGITFDEVDSYANKMAKSIHDRKIQSHIEHSWIAFNLMLFSYFDIYLDMSEQDAELLFWQASDELTAAPGIKDALQRLEQAKKPIGVVSNSVFSAATLRWELEQHGMLRYFSFVISSADCGIRKPHYLIFELAAAQLRIHPNEILFIGNDVHADCLGAQACGMQTLLYTGKEPPTEEVTMPELQRWHDLPRLLHLD